MMSVVNFEQPDPSVAATALTDAADHMDIECCVLLGKCSQAARRELDQDADETVAAHE